MTTVEDKERERVLQILRKLKAHQESAQEIGSVAEAEVFAMKISEILVKHKLEMSEVDQVIVNEVDPIDEQYTNAQSLGIKSRRKRIAWQEELAGIISVAHFCRVLVAPRTNSLWWVGRASDRQVCIFLFTVIARQVESYVDKEYRRRYSSARYHSNENSVRGWRAGFYKGLNERLRERFLQKRRSTIWGAMFSNMDAARWRNKGGQERALVVLHRADETVGEYIKQRYGKGKGHTVKEHKFSRRSVDHDQGIRDGMEFANQLPINARGLEEGLLPNQPALNKGN